MRKLFWPMLAAALVFVGMAAYLVFLDREFRSDIYDGGLELASYDLRQQLTARPSSTPVLLGGIDEPSLEQLGPWPWPRGYHALLLADLFGRGAESVFLDLLLEEEREGDQELAAALKQGYGVIGGQATRGTVEGAVVVLPPPVAPGLAPAAGIGLINKLEDDDGTVREALLAMAVDGARWPPKPLPSPALLLYLHHLGVDPDSVEYFVNGVPLAAMLPNVRNLEWRDYRGRLSFEGHSLPLRVGANPEDRALFFKLPVVYQPPQTGEGRRGPAVVSYVELPEKPVQDQVIVIGENTDSETDLVKTPAGRMKGFEAHAQAFQALVDQRYLRRLEYPMALIAGLGLLLGLLLGLTPSWRFTLLTCTLFAAGYFLLSCVLFRLGWWIPLATPLAQVGLTGLALMLLRMAVARRVFAEFAAPEAAMEMLVSETGDELEADTVLATIVVTDIRGYTTLSETRTPVEMLNLLNQYHTATVAVYNRHGGRALTYQGDAQLVVFGYPKRLKDPARAATQAAVELQQVVTRLRKLWNVSDESFSVGAAVCTGWVVIGRRGAAEAQIQYTVIGDPVRRAHKIQSMSDKLDSPVLLDFDSAESMNSRLRLESLGLTEVEGLDEPIQLFRPLDHSSR